MNSVRSKPALQRWLLPYADLLTVLFVAVLAIKVTPDAPRQAPQAAPQMLAATTPLKQPVMPTVVPTHRPVEILAVKQVLHRWHGTTNFTGEVMITLPQNVLFQSNQYGLTTQGIKQLMGLKPLLKLARGRIRVEGHTDSQPPAKPLTNRQLSALRASVVADALTQSLGIPANRVVALGHGDSHPLKDNRTATGRQANRRVVLVIEPAPKQMATGKPRLTPHPPGR